MAQLVNRAKMFAKDNRTEFVRFVKFGIVGTIGAVVDFGLLNLGIQVFGRAKWLANTLSFSAAVVSNFVWNRLWTYPEARHEPFGPQLGQFFIVNLAGLGINQAIFLSLDCFAPWGYNISKAIAVGVVLFWNYGVNRLWTFRNIR